MSCNPIMTVKFENCVKYYGKIKNSLPHGYGKAILSDKSEYEGKWKNGFAHGKGKLISGTLFYKGSFENGIFNGYGSYTDFELDENNEWTNCCVYEGNFIDSEFTGEGALIESFLSKYKDNFKENNEYCSYYYGNFYKDLKDGYGEYKFQDGTIYKGYWKNDKMHGKGKLIKDNYLIYEGEFQDGEMHGYGTKYFSELKRIYNGEFSMGKPYGNGTLTLENGKTITGYWQGENRVSLLLELSDNNSPSVKIINEMEDTLPNSIELQIHNKSPRPSYQPLSLSPPSLFSPLQPPPPPPSPNSDILNSDILNSDISNLPIPSLTSPPPPSILYSPISNLTPPLLYSPISLSETSFPENLQNCEFEIVSCPH